MGGARTRVRDAVSNPLNLLELSCLGAAKQWVSTKYVSKKRPASPSEDRAALTLSCNIEGVSIIHMIGKNRPAMRTLATLLLSTLVPVLGAPVLGAPVLSQAAASNATV